MRKINTRHFHLATRSTARAVNRQIVLNLIREHQPISRAELARRMDVRRSALTAIVRELVATGEVVEKGTAATMRGRRPRLLFVRTHGRLVAAADVRPGRTSVALADFTGREIARDAFETPESPLRLVEELARRVEGLLRAVGERGGEGALVCEGMGVVVPGMVDRRSGRILYAPRLGWRDVEIRDSLSGRLGMKVFVESAPIACALARLWLSPEETRSVRSFAYVSVSDGIGVGLVFNGETLRGEAHTAGEFGHVTLDPLGRECACGKRGCWEALACNAATVAQYAERVSGPRPVHRAAGGALALARESPTPMVEDVIRRARRGEPAAVAALAETGRHIGRGLAAVVSAFNPGRIYIGGEVTAALGAARGSDPAGARRGDADGRDPRDARAARPQSGGVPAARRGGARRGTDVRGAGRGVKPGNLDVDAEPSRERSAMSDQP